MRPDDRVGISFTLTIVITGVILLMTALSIITLGGTSINQFFGQTQSETQDAELQARINDRCADLQTQIDNQYCSVYVKPTDCTATAPQRNTTHSVTRSENGDCNWVTAANGFDREVTVEGNTYDCINQGVISDEFCPAG
ncbi:MAG: hypothetical protein SVW77_03425 [Candidatus Nanohaloarchaea archaeon]|nr:hypothetical protein [Candidatus Nanohaloarchaea archaeon]